MYSCLPGWQSSTWHDKAAWSTIDKYFIVKLGSYWQTGERCWWQDRHWPTSVREKELLWVTMIFRTYKQNISHYLFILRIFDSMILRSPLFYCYFGGSTILAYICLKKTGLRWMLMIYVIKMYQKGKNMFAKYKDVIVKTFSFMWSV